MDSLGDSSLVLVSFTCNPSCPFVSQVSMRSQLMPIKGRSTVTQKTLTSLTPATVSTAARKSRRSRTAAMQLLLRKSKRSQLKQRSKINLPPARTGKLRSLWDPSRQRMMLLLQLHQIPQLKRQKKIKKKRARRRPKLLHRHRLPERSRRSKKKKSCLCQWRTLTLRESWSLISGRNKVAGTRRGAGGTTPL